MVQRTAWGAGPPSEPRCPRVPAFQPPVRRDRVPPPTPGFRSQEGGAARQAPGRRFSSVSTMEVDSLIAPYTSKHVYSSVCCCQSEVSKYVFSNSKKSSWIQASPEKAASAFFLVFVFGIPLSIGVSRL
ncbi:uncharacterized protein LOC132669505 [Panthera onca]